MSIADRATEPWLLYGAYGYTGALIARRAVELGMAPVLAGRDGRRTGALASELGLEHRVFPLDDPDGLRAGLSGVAAVLHAAGPFSRTSRPMVDACLATGTHYLDITGEIDVLESLVRRDEQARRAGIAVLPSVGFDVVPTDCAAALAASRVRDVTGLEIAFHTRGRASRGTTRSSLEGLRRPARERRGGRLVSFRHGSIRTTVPFEDRGRTAVAIPWGDVVTAHHTTAADDIRTYMAIRPAVVPWLWLTGWLRPLLALPPLRSVLGRWAERRARRPDDDSHRTGSARIRVLASSATTGESSVVELTTPDAYALTADAAARAAARVARGKVGAGFQTPAGAFGPAFVGSLDGVVWVRGAP